ncbi:MAG TPA: acyl-CoA synthetase [Burkholderiaceae bacterium]|nr:acyl-CoA synthetase [Burkholderiaceae bacterium]
MSAAPAWARERERGNALALRVMAFIAVACGRRVARGLLHPITLYFVLFARASARHSARYLARALGRPARWRDRYRHVFTFAATVLDRVYFARGRSNAFDLRVEGAPLMDELVAQGRGALLLGAHLGSFEALHAVGASRPGLRVAMAMFPDNARLIQQTLHALAPDFHLDIIEIGRAHSTLAIRDWLDAGGLVGVLGDRALGHEGPRSGSVELPFLGRPARFSDAPLRLAMLLRRRVVFMVALYRGGARYDVRFEPLADFTQPAADAAQRDNRLREALAAYVQRLEALCREAPTNWFNFFDFWNEDARA